MASVKATTGKQSALDAALQKTKAISVTTTKLVSAGGSETKYPVTSRKPFSSPPNAGLDEAKVNLDNYIKIVSKTSTFWRNKDTGEISYVDPMSEGSIGYYLHEDPVYDLVSLQPAAKPKAVVTKPAAVPATVAKPASAPTTTSKPTSTAVKPKPAPTSAPVVASTTATTTTAAAATIAPKPTVVPVPAVVKSAPTMVSKPTPTPAPSIKPAPVVTKTAHTPMAAEFDDGFGMDLAPDPDDLPPSPPSVKSAPTSSSIPAADNSSQYSWLGMKKKAPVAKEPTTSDYKLYEDTFSKKREEEKAAADKEKASNEAALDPKSIWKLREAKAKDTQPAGLRGYMNRMWSSKKMPDGSSSKGESSPPPDSSSPSVPVK